MQFHYGQHDGGVHHGDHHVHDGYGYHDDGDICDDNGDGYGHHDGGNHYSNPGNDYNVNADCAGADNYDDGDHNDHGGYDDGGHDYHGDHDDGGYDDHGDDCHWDADYDAGALAGLAGCS